MADGKIVIETDLDSSGVKNGLKKLGSITEKALKTTTVAITGTATAMGGIATAAVKIGSDFEKQMSRVQAISGATEKEFESLRKKAIELGADTAFSSQEVAQGMENLAAAGFTTNEIISSMPGMLDLAAASGEDLADSADIAASVLRGFGLDANDAANGASHVADVLAENANRTNSSVAETGEAMKYIAPLARAAGISMEETAAAIGIMANSGIQGSQAGTTLRGALSRLSKPTDAMVEAMDELGISFYDSNGKMKSLKQQIGMLDRAMEGMTDEQKNNYLVTLYGQEALSGMLTLINEGENSLGDLTEAYKNCDGSAKKAAKTMQDNLAGSLEQLGGAAESLGIVFYDTVSDSLKEAAETATASVESITDAFNNGGLDAAIQAAGDEFANLAVIAADHAPEMVDTAVDFIESFVDGVYDNKDRLLSSAGDMAETLAGGLAQLLPTELREPVEEAIEAVSDSLKSGGLSEGADTFRRTIDTAIDAAGALADIALPALTKSIDFVGDHMDAIIPLATSAATAFVAYQTATAASTTATLVAEKAQKALNAALNANPAALIIAGVIAFASGVAVLAANASQASEEQIKFNREMDKLDEKIQKTREGLDNLSDSMKSTYDSAESSAAPLERLKGKLGEVFDSTGKVIEGNENLAQSVINQLNEAMGTSYSLTADGFIQSNDGVKQSLDEVTKSIDQYVIGLKQKAISETVSTQYADAVQKQAEAQQNLTEAQEKYNDALDKYAKARANVDSTPKEIEEAGENLKKTTEALKETTGAATEADSAVSGLDEIMDMLGEGTPEKIEEAVNAYAKLPVEAEKAGEGVVASSELIQKSLDSTDPTKMIEGFRLAAEQIEKSGGEIPESLQESLAAAVKRFDEISPEAAGQAQAMMQTMMEAMEDEVPGFKKVASKNSEEVINTFSKYLINSGALADVGTESIEKLAGGIESGKDKSDKASKKVAKSANEKLGSEDTKKTGSIKVQEYAAGSESAKKEVDKTSESVAKSSNEKLGSEDTKKTGSKKTKEYNEGLDSNKKTIDKTSKNIAESSDKNLGSKDTEGTGSRKSKEYDKGIGSNKGSIDKTSKNIATSSDKNLGSADTQKTGSKKTQEYDKGVASNKKQIEKTSKSIADSSNKNLGSADTQKTGSRKTQEYDKGVNSNKAQIDKTSKNIATSSNTNLGSADTRGTGSRKGNEFNSGIKSKEGTISSTSRSLSNKANEGFGSADTMSTGLRKSNDYDKGLSKANTYSTGKAKASEGNIGFGDTDTYRTGLGKSNDYDVGLAEANTWSTGNAKAGEANSGFGDVDTWSTGADESYSYDRGLAAANTWSTGNAKAGEANSGLGDVDTWGTGNNVVGNYISGMYAGDTWGAGSNKSEEGKSGLGSADTWTAGFNFVDGFSSGMSAINLWDAAWSIGNSALNAIKSALGIHSPSREARIVGEYFGEGLSLGIESEEKAVMKSSEGLAKAALDSMDMQAVTSRMREAMAINRERVVSGNLAARYIITPESQETEPQGDVNQTVNIYQPVSSPVEMSRALRKEARRLAYRK